MRIILKVSSSNEHCNGGCEFALLDLTPELARLAVGRIATLREQKSLDPDIDEVYYWAYFAEYFSPWKDPASTGEEVEGTGMTLEEMLDELAIEEKEIACVPETFQVPPHQIAAVECEQIIVRLDSIVFMAIPKHASFYVQTVELPLAMLEAAAATSTSPAHV
jgi:sulfur carrier protein ThiS